MQQQKTVSIVEEGHQEMSARIERATLESMASAAPEVPGLPQQDSRKYPYSESDAEGYAGIIDPILMVWSSRWKIAEPFSEEERDILAKAAGRYIAWKYPGNGDEMHPGAVVLMTAITVSIPRAMQIWAAKNAAEEEKKEEQDQGQENAVAH